MRVPPSNPLSLVPQLSFFLPSLYISVSLFAQLFLFGNPNVLLQKFVPIYDSLNMVIVVVVPALKSVCMCVLMCIKLCMCVHVCGFACVQMGLETKPDPYNIQQRHLNCSGNSWKKLWMTQRSLMLVNVFLSGQRILQETMLPPPNISYVLECVIFCQLVKTKENIFVGEETNHQPSSKWNNN